MVAPQVYGRSLRIGAKGDDFPITHLRQESHFRTNTLSYRLKQVRVGRGWRHYGKWK